LTSPKTAESIYQVSTEGSLLRKYTANLLNYQNPFNGLEEGSKSWNEWKALQKRYPDLSNDMVTRAGQREWKGTHPWDEQYRASYTEKDAPLEEKWKQQILAKRSKADIQEAARSQHLQAIIELDNLERDE
jgi:hypothetical protein